MTLIHYSIHFLWLRMYVCTYVHTSGMSDSYIHWWVLMSLVDQTNGTETVHTLHLLHAHVYICLWVSVLCLHTPTLIVTSAVCSIKRSTDTSACVRIPSDPCTRHRRVVCVQIVCMVILNSTSSPSGCGCLENVE